MIKISPHKLVANKTGLPEGKESGMPHSMVAGGLYSKPYAPVAR